jgi:hypothetical protein
MQRNMTGIVCTYRLHYVRYITSSLKEILSDTFSIFSINNQIAQKYNSLGISVNVREGEPR